MILWLNPKPDIPYSLFRNGCLYCMGQAKLPALVSAERLLAASPQKAIAIAEQIFSKPMAASDRYGAAYLAILKRIAEVAGKDNVENIPAVALKNRIKSIKLLHQHLYSEQAKQATYPYSLCSIL